MREEWEWEWTEEERFRVGLVKGRKRDGGERVGIWGSVGNERENKVDAAAAMAPHREMRRGMNYQNGISLDQVCEFSYGYGPRHTPIHGL